MSKGGKKASEQSADEQVNHSLKLSIDLLSVKDLNVAANVTCSYQIKLSSGSHSFKTDQPTAVGQSGETKLLLGFASYEFQASKSQLFALLAGNNFKISLHHKTHDKNEQLVGVVLLDMKDILTAPLKKSASAMLRVADQYLPIKG